MGNILTPGSGIEADSTETLTNKTFDANGTGNSLSNVDVEDLADGTDGELVTWDSAGEPDTVAVGTVGQVLKSGGTGAAPAMEDLDVAVSELADGTDGELITWDASGNPAVVAVGSVDEVLTSNGEGAAPTFQAAGGGGGAYEYIESLTASTSASLDFENGIDDTGTEYLFIFENIKTSNNTQDFGARFSIDGGSSYINSNYTQCTIRINGDTVSGLDTTGKSSCILGGNMGTETDEHIVGWAKLHHPSASGFQTRVTGRVAGITSTPTPRQDLAFCTNSNTSVVNAIQFLNYGGGTLASGTIHAYRLKNS